MTPIMVNYLAVVIAAVAGLRPRLGLVHGVRQSLGSRLAARLKADFEGRGPCCPSSSPRGLCCHGLDARRADGPSRASHGQRRPDHGFFVWVGFVLTTIGVNQAFHGTKPLVTLIDAGHWLAVLLVMGAIIGAFGV